MKELVPDQTLAARIYFIRGERVIVDADLARLYGVPTKSLNLAFRRNRIRFPSDFMFRLSAEESRDLRFQTETSSWGGRRYRPWAFTEQGVAMLSSVLRSERAALVNIAIMRAFVQLRKSFASKREIEKKLKELENHLEKHEEDFFRLAA